MDPMIRKLVSLREECEKKGIPDFVTSGIDDAMRLFEVNTHWRFIFYHNMYNLASGIDITTCEQSLSVLALAPESQTLMYMVTAPKAYHRSSKCMKTSKKHDFIKLCSLLLV